MVMSMAVYPYLIIIGQQRQHLCDLRTAFNRCLLAQFFSFAYGQQNELKKRPPKFAVVIC